MLIFPAATFGGRKGTVLVPVHHYMMMRPRSAVPHGYQAETRPIFLKPAVTELRDLRASIRTIMG
jgi:hypothetical protein